MNDNKECVEIAIEMTLWIMHEKTIFGFLSKNGSRDAFNSPIYNPNFADKCISSARHEGFMRWEKHKAYE